MPEFTIDTNVIMNGCDMSDSGDKEACIRLLRGLESTAEYSIAIDSKNKIRGEYERKLGSSSAGQHWLRRMASRGKIQTVKWKKLPKKCLRQLLDKCHFDTSDIPFVETAYETDIKHIATEDDDYENSVKKLIWKELKVKACTARETCEAFDL